MKDLACHAARNRFWSLLGLSLVPTMLAACASSQLVSQELETQISRDVTFSSVRADPHTFTGKEIVLGGKVLSAKLLPGQTQIELLELPLDEYDRPLPDLTQSKGRFLAFHAKDIDPATLPAGTLVSLVGEVMGSKTLPLDEASYKYVTIKVVTMKTWQENVLMYVYDPWYSRWGPWSARRYGYPFAGFHPYWVPF